MRVGWVVDGSLDQLSGGYLYDRLVVDHLRRQSVEVVVLSLPTGSYGARLGRGLVSQVPGLADAGRLDALVEDELSHPALIAAHRRWAAAHPGLPRVGLVHHLRSSEPRLPLANVIYRWIERRYLASLGAFIFNSQATLASVRRLGLAASPSVVAVPGADRLAVPIDPESIRARSQAPGALQLLFLGNLIPRKGLLPLVEAVALLPPGSVELTVVGSTAADPAYARRVRRRVEQLRLQASVRFQGALDGLALHRTMIEAQVLAVPSTYEGYGMAYLEGMGCGLPPIAGTEGGASEFIRHTWNGLRIEPDDPPALAVHLAALHTDRARLARMSLAALDTYLAHPTWEDTGSTIHRFLSDLTNGVPSSGGTRSFQTGSVLSSAERPPDL
jgi:glycosyltransferase involved in cell wall biosynthesis